MWSRSDLKERAKRAFTRNYWPMVLVGVIMMMCAGGSGGSFGRSTQNIQKEYQNMDASTVYLILTVVGIAVLIAMVIGLLLCLFVKYPFEVGCSRFLIINRRVTPNMGEIVFGYKGSLKNNIKILFLRDLYVFLWSLLFIIPGIVKSYEYRMIPYLLAENPDLTVKEAFEISKRMMSGEKWNTFVLDLSFIGWTLLSGITLGLVGIFWYNPYYFQTNAELYGALSAKGNPYFERSMQNYPGGMNPGGSYPGGMNPGGSYPGGPYPN